MKKLFTIYQERSSVQPKVLFNQKMRVIFSKLDLSRWQKHDIFTLKRVKYFECDVIGTLHTARQFPVDVYLSLQGRILFMKCLQQQCVLFFLRIWAEFKPFTNVKLKVQVRMRISHINSIVVSSTKIQNDQRFSRRDKNSTFLQEFTLSSYLWEINLLKKI